MAKRKKKNGGGMSQTRKWAKKAIGVIRLVVGVAGFGGPTIRAVAENIATPGALPSAIVYRNTGIDGNGNFDQVQAQSTAVTFIATGIALIVLTWAGRRI